MLCSLPRVRSVVEISYGCIGRSDRQPSTASARGFETRRLVTGPPLFELEYPDASMRGQGTGRGSAGQSQDWPADALPGYQRWATSTTTRLVAPGPLRVKTR